MLGPEEQQMELCLLNLNLDSIINDLFQQESALPSLDAENERQYSETLRALQDLRTANAEGEKLKMENCRLTSRLIALKRQCAEKAQSLENARENRNVLLKQLKDEQQEDELVIRYYEDKCHEIADRFRGTHWVYYKNMVKADLEKLRDEKAELESENSRAKAHVESLKKDLDDLKPAIPADILNIFGKDALSEKLEKLKVKREQFEKKRNDLLKPKAGNSNDPLKPKAGNSNDLLKAEAGNLNDLLKPKAGNLNDLLKPKAGNSNDLLKPKAGNLNDLLKPKAENSNNLLKPKLE